MPTSVVHVRTQGLFPLLRKGRRRRCSKTWWRLIGLIATAVAAASAEFPHKFLLCLPVAESWSFALLPTHNRNRNSSSSNNNNNISKKSRTNISPYNLERLSAEQQQHNEPEITTHSVTSRRRAVQGIATVAATAVSFPVVSKAYTPDPDKLQESLYFISRVQEATVQQERFINKLGGGTQEQQQQLRVKLKLTLRLVDKNYKLLDQINYSSAYVTPADKLVEASEAGYEAVDALQSAIEFVNKDDNWNNSNKSEDDRNVVPALTGALQSCREQLLVYTEFMPQDKLRNARYRVEDENIRNRDEFDGDEDAGVYNPVNLPWKPVLLGATKGK